MGRQPIKMKGNLGIALGPGFLPDKAAELIGHCMALGSEIDLQYARLLAALMKANEEPTVAIYMTIRQFRIQTAVLNEAAQYALAAPHELKLFRAIRDIGNELESQRNDLAHGILGSTTEYPDAVIWMDARDRIKHMLMMARHPAHDFPHEKMKWLKEHTSIYERKDLEQLKNDMTEHHRAVYDLVSLVSLPGGSVERVGRYDLLSQQPRIQSELSRP